MTNDNDKPSPGTETYWDEISEADHDELAGGKTVLDVVEERTAGERDVRAVIHADTGSDGTMYLLVIYTRMSDSGDMVLGERYFSLHPDKIEEAGYGKQGIERRVSGALATALKVAYAATDGGAGMGDRDVFAVSADPEGVDNFPDSLTKILPGTVEREIPPEERGKVEGRETAICNKCEKEAPASELMDIGGDLAEVLVHRGGCPDEEGDE